MISLWPHLRACTDLQSNSTVYYELVNYDDAQSTVIFDTQRNALACCNMVPPFPNFPNDWTATIETNNLWSGFTQVTRELYSKTHNAVSKAPYPCLWCAFT